MAIWILSPIDRFFTARLIQNARRILDISDVETIAISGSYGKSSIKNFLTAILGTHKPTIRTDGNINTLKGIAHFVCDVFQNNNDITYFVCEMWWDTPGEISAIGSMIQHRIGFLTGLNNQHAALYGGLEAAIDSETEIFEQLNLYGWTLYVNMDSRYLDTLVFPNSVRLVGYSMSDPQCAVFSAITGHKADLWSFDLFYQGVRYHFSTDVVGKHNILNLSWVIACCFDLGMNAQSIEAALSCLSSHQKTLQRFTVARSCLIDDRYNINVDGVCAGVALLSDYTEFDIKVVVINEIMELGREANKTHYDLGLSLSSYDLDYIFLTGENYGSYIKHWLLSWGFDEGRIIDCVNAGRITAFSTLSHLVHHFKAVVLFLWREQWSLKFFDELLV